MLPYLNTSLAQLLMAITDRYVALKNQYNTYTVSVQTFPYVGGILVQIVIQVVYREVPGIYVLESYLVPYDLLPLVSYQSEYDVALGPGQCGPSVFDVMSAYGPFYEFVIASAENYSTPLLGMDNQLTRLSGILGALPNYPFPQPPGGPGQETKPITQIIAPKGNLRTQLNPVQEPTITSLLKTS